MTADALVAARIATETKQLFARLAHEQGLSESALLKRLIDGAIGASGGITRHASDEAKPFKGSGRLSIRLDTNDLLLLRERATGRGMPVSTLVSMIVRSHLRSLAPLPTAELAVLKRSVAEVGAIGRNINQIARAVNRGEDVGGLSRSDLYAILRALTGLRDHTKGLIKANLESWKSGG